MPVRRALGRAWATPPPRRRARGFPGARGLGAAAGLVLALAAAAGGDPADEGAVAALERSLALQREALGALGRALDLQAAALEQLRAGGPGGGPTDPAGVSADAGGGRTLRAAAAAAGAGAAEALLLGASGEARQAAAEERVVVAGAGRAGGAGGAALQQTGTARTLARFHSSWGEYMKPIALNEVGRPVTAVFVMPQRGRHGIARYVAVGDAGGGVSIFEPRGGLKARVAGASAVTALHCIVLTRNTTVLLSGHADGSVRRYKVEEAVIKDPHEPDPVLRLEVYPDAAPLQPPAPAPVGHLDVYRQGQSKYYAVVQGRTLALLPFDPAEPRREFPLNHTVVALRTSHSSTAIVVTAAGLTRVNLRTMDAADVPCRGLNGSALAAAAFDSVTVQKLYAVTAAGELLAGFVSVDSHSTRCTFRSRSALGVAGPASISTIKGYVFVGVPGGLGVFNVSGLRHAPRQEIGEDLNRIVQGVGLPPREEWAAPPALVANKQRLVLVQVADGVLASFESNLPLPAPKERHRMWSQPLVLGAMILVGFWQYQKQKAAGVFDGTGNRGRMAGDFRGMGRSPRAPTDDDIMRTIHRFRMQEQMDGGKKGR